MSQLRLNAFMDHLIDFLDDLRQTFHEVIEIQTAYNQLNMWGDTTAVKVKSLKAFMYCCASCYEEVFREQEEFFTDLDNLKDVKNQKQFQKFGGDDEQEQQNSMMTILQLKDYWSELSETNKGQIWIHMKALLVKGAGTILNLDFTPSPEEQDEWDKLVQTCRELLLFAKKNQELYRGRPKSKK